MWQVCKQVAKNLCSHGLLQAVNRFGTSCLQLVTPLLIFFSFVIIVTKTPHKYIRVHTSNIRVTYVPITYGYIRVHTRNIPVTYGYIRVHTGKTRALGPLSTSFSKFSWGRIVNIHGRKGSRIKVFMFKFILVPVV